MKLIICPWLIWLTLGLWVKKYFTLFMLSLISVMSTKETISQNGSRYSL